MLQSVEQVTTESIVRGYQFLGQRGFRRPDASWVVVEPERQLNHYALLRRGQSRVKKDGGDIISAITHLDTNNEKIFRNIIL